MPVIDDDLLDLAADCYVALRSRGGLREFPTFESFFLRALGASDRGRGSLPLALADLVPVAPPESPPTN